MVQKHRGSEDSWRDKLHWRKLLKHFNSRKNRRHTRQKILRQEYDGIPQNKPVKEDNPWNWD